MISPVILLGLLAMQGSDCRSCDLLANLASALSASDGVRFMRDIDKSAPGYQDIASRVAALSAQNDIVCSLDVLKESGDDDSVEAVVDWYMDITSKADSGPSERRRTRVKVVEKKIRGVWKVTEIDPRSILDPLTVK